MNFVSLPTLFPFFPHSRVSRKLSLSDSEKFKMAAPKKLQLKIWIMNWIWWKNNWKASLSFRKGEMHFRTKIMLLKNSSTLITFTPPSTLTCYIFDPSFNTALLKESHVSTWGADQIYFKRWRWLPLMVSL